MRASILTVRSTIWTMSPAVATRSTGYAQPREPGYRILWCSSRSALALHETIAAAVSRIQMENPTEFLSRMDFSEKKDCS